MACLALGACSETDDLAHMSCKDIAAEAVDISKGQLVSIDGRELTSRTRNRVVCHGNGLYTDGSEVPTRFEAFFNDDREMMVRYDTNEYTALQERIAEAKADRDEAADREQTMKEIDRALDQ